MTEFTIELAGIPIAVSALFPSTQVFCRDYLTQRVPQYRVELSQQDIAWEREKSAQEDLLEGIAVRSFSDAYLETLALYRKLVVLLLDEGILLFHGSVVAVENRSYLFTATSGTGKSTHTHLWLETIPSAFIVNGDKPLLKLTAEGVWVYGTPWQGKENEGCPVCVPLQAICLLERDTHNHIHEISMAEALPMLIQQSYRPNERLALQKTLQLIGKLCTVKFYRLGCTMAQEAAWVAWRGMGGETL